ncbi:SUMF1/EgtB/PvdO family nonheme iron enzyme [Amycolatopsis rubida]|uniref:SUMF1/EgtB/PvdO family nonheme iron enzyme n=1 Tax=Amycolatopsis rubida TaxID=112413 RepID=A0ABX0BJN4_9PSEU|nr:MULTISPECIES: SUMF1/EgtB/PvdO family nonheme iron enzyme [Amycolatopsis]MYW90082.1 SUMF1/EgtB/PvdO family nonheme iron enzyme [Amycolatopsis rubida]NEC55059.1 SUMF1/EgtB/PvdO family nonheme iron enzyme [Amycolatopsis rubida]OAP21161.1 Formylglycine-generating sulfatase enzyme [Amycolatopsis sp. M39]
MTYVFDPLVPRPIDQPTEVPLGAPLSPEQLAALDEAKIFVGPADPADRPEWRARLRQWRADAHERHGYHGRAYDRPEAAWAAGCHTVAQVWLWDELLYSFEEHRFTPERFLADAHQRFGGLDAVVLWHAYPVIGLDDRNQWDFYRDVPGLRELAETFHSAGTRVFVDYNPWDVGTRRGEDDAAELSAVLADSGADGVFLDTLKKADPALVEQLERARPGVVLEGESKLPVERIEDHSASWAQFFADSPVPGVLRSHWYERRHMQHHVRRWHRDHTEELHSAWLNGVGVMVWEVVFGVWVGWSQRDAATVRRMVSVQRAAGELLREGEWTPLAPLTPEAEAAGVYASRWELGDWTLWTVVNRGDSDYLGPVVDGPVIDLFADGRVPARGISALLRVADGAAEPSWLSQVATLPHDPDARFPHRLATRVQPQPTSGTPEDDAVMVPAGPYVLTVRYRGRETGMYQGAPYVDEWKPLPPRLHDARTLQRDGSLASPVAVAAAEVTNGEFAEFLATTGYQPVEAHRFLAHWADGQPAAEDEPVTFVDLDDARAYCAWRGGRLPTEDEWQLAGETGGLRRGTPAVWNWTESEHSDGRTRFVMLKGGSDYRAEGSEWYVEGGRHAPDYSVKLLLPGFGLARGATVGFRCAWDVTR